MPIAALTRFRRCLLAIAVMLALGSCAGSDEQLTTTIDDDLDPTPAATTQPLEPPVAGEPDLIVAATTPLPSAVPDRSEAPPSPPEVLTIGSEGAAVEDAQDLLNDFIGYADVERNRIAEDGVYGPNTEAAQQSFETYAELDIDGTASMADRSRLDAVVAELESASAESVVARGDQSSFVGTWQSRLNTWNELVVELPTTITVDNRFGEDTETATLAVEAALGLQVDGIVEPEDRVALRAAISRVRANNDATVLRRTTIGDTPVVVKALYVNDRYCVRFIVGVAADERCTAGPGGDVNTAYSLSVNGVSFVGGTANPNVAFVQIGVRGEGTTPVGTRKLGNSLARAWVEIVDQEPDTVELLEADGTSVLELRFSIAPTDREFFDATISLLSPEYAQTFFVDECSRPNGTDLVLEASLANSTLVVNVLDGIGSLVIDSGTDAAPIQIAGGIEQASISDEEVVLTGTFAGDVFDGAAFTATTSC